MFVRGEDDVTYFPLKIQEPTTAKIKEEVCYVTKSKVGDFATYK